MSVPDAYSKGILKHLRTVNAAFIGKIVCIDMGLAFFACSVIC